MQRLRETIRCYALFLIIYPFFTVNTSNGSWISTIENSPGTWQIARYTCGFECYDGKVVRLHGRDECYIPTCFRCECDETCIVKGTCCPFDNGTLSSKYLLMESHTSDPSSDHFYNRLRCIKHPLIMMDFLAAARCPQNWTDDVVKKQCEDPKGDSLASIIPYFDREIKVAYTNIFCLLCNGHDPDSKESVTNAQSDEFANPPSVDEPRFQALPLNFDCRHYQNLFNLTDLYSMYLAALELEECDVYLKEPNGLTYCPMHMELQEEPENCTDKLFEALCHDIPPFPGFSVTGAKNLYCFLCSGQQIRRSLRCGPDIGTVNRYPPIYMLFTTSKQLHSHEDQLTIGCLPGHWADGTGQCVPSNCSAGKELQPEESCSTVLNSIQGLGYDLHMVLTPDNIINMGSKEEESLQSVITALLDSLARLEAKYNLTYYITRQSCFQDSTYYVESIRFVGNIQGPRSMPRDEFEENLFKLVTTSSWNLTITDSEGKPQTLRMSLGCLGNDQCEAFITKFVGGKNMRDCVKEISNGNLGENLEQLPNLIEVRPDMICPTVSLAPSKDPEVVNGKFTPTAQLKNKEVRFTDVSRFSFVNNKLLVCLDFLKKVSIHQRNEAGSSASVSTDDIIRTVNYYLDIACIVVSCTCLVGSIITYCMLPSMRSLPGRNNMCLCVSLLTAHLSLLITSLQGFSVSLEKLHCLVHAVILHYSWVASFLWMNSCCIHMFRVFTGRNFGDDRKKFALYCLCSFGIPALVIASTIAITAVATSGASWGYDDDICFLDTRTSSLVVILGFLAPLGVSVAINGGLFGMTIKEIVHVTRLQQEKKSHVDVLVYCKLSTVTGLFCLLAGAAVQFQTPLLSLLASPLAALQGVFIFASFIANKRVGNMYLDLVRTSSTNQNTATTHSRKY